MKVAILAGGMGTRLQEETVVKPKPMVEIGRRPLIWHIMKTYEVHGHKEFVLALGYKGELIKQYFVDYHKLRNNLSVRLSDGKVTSSAGSKGEEWQVHLVDTGDDAMTGGRLKALAPWIGPDTFMMTYGDGVSSVNLKDLLKFHKAHGKLATVTAVRPPARFGGMRFEGDQVVEFLEKPQIGEGWINGGFFVLEPKVLEYIHGPSTVFEREPLERLARDGQLVAFRHEGFWQCMDTVRDLRLLEELWESGRAPWKVWT